VEAIQDAARGIVRSYADRLEDESAWLFDASRDYLEQLAVYKARRGATL